MVFWRALIEHPGWYDLSMDVERCDDSNVLVVHPRTIYIAAQDIHLARVLMPNCHTWTSEPTSAQITINVNIQMEE